MCSTTEKLKPSFLKGTLKWSEGGGGEWHQSITLKKSYVFPAIKIFFKGPRVPGPLNILKRFRAAKQRFMCLTESCVHRHKKIIHVSRHIEF
jgi:hypothetical protein